MSVQFNHTPFAAARGIPLEAIVGIIPQFLSYLDPRDPVEQINEAYAHGGGWNDFDGFTFDPVAHSIKYPGDPKHEALAETVLNGKRIFVYESAWVAVWDGENQPRIARLD